MRFNAIITSDHFDRRLCQLLCFGGAPVILICAVSALNRMGAAPAELLTGVLAASALSVSIVVLGIVSGTKPPAA